MNKQLLITTTLLLGSTLMPFVTHAETSNPVTTSGNLAPGPSGLSDTADMSKSQWLNTIVPMLPSLICKGFMGDPELKQRLDKIKMNYGQCVSAIPASVNRCQNQLSPSIPDTINNEAASTWGRSLGECIGKDFAMKYLVPKH